MSRSKRSRFFRPLKRAVSVSLGSGKRDKSSVVTLLGEQISLERVGTDGDFDRFARTFAELDGKVDAIGVGGADIYVVAGTRRYAFRQILKAISGVKRTPVVDGSGLKHTLERETIRRLQREGTFDFRGKPVLLVSGVDRFGMAEALEEAGAKVTYGDLPFGVGVNLPIRSYRTMERLARLILPIVTRLPIQWFYPTGEKQEARTPKYGRLFAEADLICGDWHYIRRFMPERLPGKTVLTQTLRKADLEFLTASGVERAITTTPAIEGETFATNVMEAALVALLGPLDERGYQEALGQLAWRPNVIELQGAKGILTGSPATDLRSGEIPTT